MTYRHFQRNPLTHEILHAAPQSADRGGRHSLERRALDEVVRARNDADTLRTLARGELPAGWPDYRGRDPGVLGSMATKAANLLELSSKEVQQPTGGGLTVSDKRRAQQLANGATSTLAYQAAMEAWHRTHGSGTMPDDTAHTPVMASEPAPEVSHRLKPLVLPSQIGVGRAAIGDSISTQVIVPPEAAQTQILPPLGDPSAATVAFPAGLGALKRQ